MEVIDLTGRPKKKQRRVPTIDLTDAEPLATRRGLGAGLGRLLRLAVLLDRLEPPPLVRVRGGLGRSKDVELHDNHERADHEHGADGARTMKKWPTFSTITRRVFIQSP